MVSYEDVANGKLKLLHCNDPNCAGGDESIIAPHQGDNVSAYASLALDATGNPVVSYQDLYNIDLMLLRCNDPNCAGQDESIVTLDSTGDVGGWSSLALDGAGNPVVSYQDVTNEDLKVVHCDDPNCAGGGESITLPDRVSRVGWYTSLILDASGYPVVSYYDAATIQLKLLHCNDLNCAGGDETITLPDAGGGWDTSLALDANGNPVVSYYAYVNSDLKLLHCDNPACSGPAKSPAGDANCDRAVTAVDAALVLQFAAALILSNSCLDFADSNDDGSLDAIDALLILQYVAGLLSLPP